CTMKAMPGGSVGPIDAAPVSPGVPGAGGFGGTGQQGQKIHVGKFVTMTCPQNQPGYTISAPPLCVTPVAAAAPVALKNAAVYPGAGAPVVHSNTVVKKHGTGVYGNALVGGSHHK
ncbi:hypothetical protein HDU67_003922, partial [Dinochytrium kinnereticum]